MAASIASSFIPFLPIHHLNKPVPACSFKPLPPPRLSNLSFRCSTRDASYIAFSEDPTSQQSRRDVLSLVAIAAAGFGLNSSWVVGANAADQVCDFTYVPSGLGFCDRRIGSGLQASKGMIIKANYVGKLESGTVFDSSYNRGNPLTFRIGVGEVIKGWDEGILGGEEVPPMLAGGKRTLKIPPQLGYGGRGAGCRGGSCIIPPNSVLLFDVEFVGKA